MPAPLEAGTFLIASLGLEDPNFTRSVVVILQHRPEELTLGVVINRPLGDREKLSPADELHNLTNGLEAAQGGGRMFYQGGPVDPGSLIFLHREGHIEAATRICEGLYTGGDLDALRAEPDFGESDSPDLRFYLGYANWAPGQLEAEISLGAWILTPGSAELVFTEEPETAWHRALHGMGGKYAAMSFIPEDPSLN
ncbi:MAG TPA: YqgE/AlgH family protein [Candidatus Latescibacteria bacterium]|nr:YqgE/AlgH family protein [Candidatus Latescibacterota bacterium]